MKSHEKENALKLKKKKNLNIGVIGPVLSESNVRTNELLIGLVRFLVFFKNESEPNSSVWFGLLRIL
jgi:hypothetical protein